jgi:hypothetical protein
MWGALILVILFAILWWTLVASKARAEGFTQLVARDHRLLENGQLWVRLGNDASEEAYVERVDVGALLARPAIRIDLGDTSPWFELGETGLAGREGEPYEVALTIHYAVPRSGQARVSRGVIRGSYTRERPV